MATKSTGQIVGTVVGGIIGAFIPGGYIMLGAAIGGAIGGAVDPPKGPDIEGPRLSDLSVQTSGYGAMLPRVYGTVALLGTVFWIEGNALRETRKEESQGGKGGGGGSDVTTYSYSATFGVALCEGPIAGIKRIWISGKLIYDAENDTLAGRAAWMTPQIDTLQTLASLAYVFPGQTRPSIQDLLDQSRPNFTLYTGAADQAACPRMQADLGVDNTPALRHTAWILFEDLQLADYGNTLMGVQIKVEVISGDVAETQGLIAEYSVDMDTQYSAAGTLNTTTDPFDWQFWLNGGNYTEFYENRIYLGQSISITDIEERYFPGTYTVSSSQVYVNHDLGGVSLRTPDGVGSYIVLPDETKFYNVGDSPYESVVAVSGITWRTSLIDGISYYYLCNGRYGGTNFNKVAKYSTTGGEPIVVAGPDEAAWSFYVNAAIYGIKNSSPVLVNLYDDDLAYVEQKSFASTTLSTQSPSWLEGRTLYAFGYTASIAGFGFTGNYIARIDIDTGDAIYTRAPESVQAAHWVPQSIRYYPQYGALSVWYYHSGSPPFTVSQFIYGVTYDFSGGITLGEIVNAECLLSGVLSSGDIDTTALTQPVKGYRVASVGAIRSALEPLASAWPFDVLQDGYQLVFLPRSQSTVATIAYDDLGAAAPGEKDVVRLSEAREMDSQLPRQVSISYLDISREYDVSEQSVERLVTDAVNHLQVSLPIVLDGDEAANIAQQTLYRAWLERNDLSFVLPPPYLNLQPTDIVTLVTPDATRDVRLTSVSVLPDGRLECTAKPHAASVYSPNAVGAPGIYTGQTGSQLPIAWPCAMTVLDTPTLADAMNKPCYLLAMSGYSEPWAGGNAYVSGDSGVSWSFHGSFPRAVTQGVATGVLAAGRTDIIDATNRVNVRLMAGSLASISVEQLLAGQGHYAIGTNGLWEIVGAMTATLEADGSYTLSNLLRGRLGSEWAMTTHAIGDRVVWLNDPDLVTTDASLNDIGLLKRWRAVPSGFAADADNAADVDFTYLGENLECLAPLNVKAYKSLADNVWNVEWTRQTRIGWAWRDNVDAALGEPSENYSIDLFANDTYSPVLGTVTATTPSLALTTAQQTAIFGSSPDALYGDIYQVSPNVGRGRGARFARIMNDPYWGNVVFASHFNGANNDTSFVDEKGASFTRAGSVVLSTTQTKFGTTSAKGVSSGSWWIDNLPQYDLGVGEDFTISCFVYIPTGSSGPICGKGYTSLTDWQFGTASDYGLSFISYYGAGVYQQVTSTTQKIPQNAWTHVAFVKSGTSGFFFIDGVKSTTTMTYTQNTRVSSPAWFSVIGLKASGSGFNGAYVDDLVITKGVARWTATFTPPTAPFLGG